MFDESLPGKRNEVLSLFLAEAAAMLAPIRPPAIKKACKKFLSVFRIRYISDTLDYGPALFVGGFQETNKNQFFCLLWYFLSFCRTISISLQR
jgi:hypothetical protein